MAFNHERADFWLPNFGLKDHFSASLIRYDENHLAQEAIFHFLFH